MKRPRAVLVMLLSFMLLGTGVVGAAALNLPHNSARAVTTAMQAPPGSTVAPGASTPATSTPSSAACKADELKGNDKPEVNAQGTPEANDQGTPQANGAKSGTDKEDAQDKQGADQQEESSAKENTAADSDNPQCGEQHEDSQSQTTSGTPAATAVPKR